MVLLAFLAFFCFSFTVDDFEYEIIDQSAMLVSSKCPNENKELIIPPKVNYNSSDYPVTMIGPNAFENCSKWTGTIKIPENII